MKALGKMRVELSERPTKDELFSIKKQLKMLQRIAFNVHDDDEGEVNVENAIINNSLE